MILPAFPLTRKLRFRRICTALFTMLAFMVSSVEVLLPELHDGDAAPRPSWSTATTDNTSAVVELTNDEVALTTDGTVPGSHQKTHPGTHIDHCGHSHAATQAREFIRSIEQRADCIAEAPNVKLVSVELPPHVRPPIL